MTKSVIHSVIAHMRKPLRSKKYGEAVELCIAEIDLILSGKASEIENAYGIQFLRRYLSHCYIHCFLFCCSFSLPPPFFRSRLTSSLGSYHYSSVSGERFALFDYLVIATFFGAFVFLLYSAFATRRRLNGLRTGEQAMQNLMRDVQNMVYKRTYLFSHRLHLFIPMCFFDQCCGLPMMFFQMHIHSYSLTLCSF